MAQTFCNCHNVSYQEVSDLIRSLDLKDIDQVRKYILCGDQGCKQCHADILNLIANNKTINK